jgi:hypothetical protein
MDSREAAKRLEEALYFAVSRYQGRTIEGSSLPISAPPDCYFKPLLIQTHAIFVLLAGLAIKHTGQIVIGCHRKGPFPQSFRSSATKTVSQRLSIAPRLGLRYQEPDVRRSMATTAASVKR